MSLPARLAQTRLAQTLLLAAALVPVTAQDPGTVLLVVNQNSPRAVQIAEYYAAKRRIPSSHICRVRAPEREDISRQEYGALAEQIGKCLTSGKLVEPVLYLATTLGLPLRIEGSTGIKGEYAAVDSELAALYFTLHNHRYELGGPASNPFFRKRDVPFGHPQFPMYLVARLTAYDVAGVKAMIDRCLQARNRGKFVLDLSSADDKMGNDWLRNAALLLPSDRTVIDESERVLYRQTDVIAYASWGSNDANHKERFSGFRWLPGAVVTEFVSTDARTFEKPPDKWTTGKWGDPAATFHGSPQSLIADYLLEGATAAAGHVYEPYLQFSPRPDYFLPAWYSGRNLAESFWLSVPAVSWQNIVAGDPLCSLGAPAQ